MTARCTKLALSAAVAVLLILVGCAGDGDDPEQAAEPTPTATEVTVVTPEPVEAAPTESASSEPDLIGISRAFLDSLDAGDHQAMVALMDPAYRDESLGSSTIAQFWTFTSRFARVASTPASCDAVGTQVECSWRGSDDLANVLGYEKRGEFLFSYEDGAIVDIIYFTNDSEIIVAITGWVDENHPGAPPCAATAEELDAYYGEPGVLAAADGEIFGTACAERLVEHAAEYRDSGLYLPPIDS